MLTANPIQYTLLTRVFGAVDTPELKDKLEDSWKELLGPIERLFLNDAAAAAAIERGCILQKAATFVTFSERTEHMKRWELSANVRFPTSNMPDKPKTVEANLQSLTRDFGACIAIPLLYRQDFLDRYPQLLDDLWKLDNHIFPLRTIGVSSWVPFKIMREGLASRSRLADQMEALYQRIDQHQNGKEVDFGADMSDVSDAALERNKIYGRRGWSIRHRGEGD